MTNFETYQNGVEKEFVGRHLIFDALTITPNTITINILARLIEFLQNGFSSLLSDIIDVNL